MLPYRYRILPRYVRETGETHVVCALDVCSWSWPRCGCGESMCVCVRARVRTRRKRRSRKMRRRSRRRRRNARRRRRKKKIKKERDPRLLTGTGRGGYDTQEDGDRLLRRAGDGRRGPFVARSGRVLHHTPAADAHCFSVLCARYVAREKRCDDDDGRWRPRQIPIKDTRRLSIMIIIL